MDKLIMMTTKKVITELNKISAKIELLEYNFFDNRNEDAALEVIVEMLDNLSRIEDIVERDDAFRKLKKKLSTRLFMYVFSCSLI